MLRILTEKDRKAVEEYLERNQIETTFLIGNVKYFGFENKKDVRRCGDYFGYFEEGKLKGIIPFYNLGSCIPHYESQNAVPYFIDLMKNREFKYLLGMRRIVEPLYDGIKKFKQNASVDEDAYFINTNLREFKLSEIQIKNYYEFDFERAVEFVVEANRIGFKNTGYTRIEAEKTLSQRPVEEDYLFVLKDGKVVATGCIQTTTDKIGQIGGVYTTPNERGKGYCRAVVSELCKRIIERGKTPTLMVRKNNTPAVRAYEFLGFEYYDEYLIIEF